MSYLIFCILFKNFNCLKFSVTPGRISQMVGPIVNKRKASRDSIILRLNRLGWTQDEIAKQIGVSQNRISEIIGNFNVKEIDNSFQKGKSVEELASYHNLDETLVWSIILEDKEDLEKFDLLNIKLKTYDVWNFPGCHKLLGQDHDGRIPDQLVLNFLEGIKVLW